MDALGRTTESTDPNGNVTYTVYKDGLDPATGFVSEVRTYPGWHYDRPSGKYTTTGPVQVSRENRPGSYSETSPTPTPRPPACTVPDGSDTISSHPEPEPADSPTLPGRWSRATPTSTSPASPTPPHRPPGHRRDVNYYATIYAYDDDGRQCKVVRRQRARSPARSSTAWAAAVSTWVGTNDTPTSGYWSPSNPAGMTMVSQNVYDNGGVGDGNLTQTTSTPAAAPPRITQSYYDWRDRQVASKSGMLLNTGGTENLPAKPTAPTAPSTSPSTTTSARSPTSEIFTGDGVAVTTTGGVPNAPSSGLLRAKTTASYDDQGRRYRTTDLQRRTLHRRGRATPSPPTSSTTYRGDTIATYTGGSGATKATFDGAGRQRHDLHHRRRGREQRRHAPAGLRRRRQRRQ